MTSQAPIQFSPSDPRIEQWLDSISMDVPESEFDAVVDGINEARAVCGPNQDIAVIIQKDGDSKAGTILVGLAPRKSGEAK